LKRNTQLKKSETRIVKGKLFSLAAKKNGCPGSLPDSQSLLYDHNSILKRSCARLVVQLSDQIKSD
jgi:hypothetical protein